jgi:hypothetical protein
MTTPAATALRTELVAAIALLKPQIKGLNGLLVMALSKDAAFAVRREAGDHARRLALCAAVLKALDALEADHYPDMPKAGLPSQLLQELLDILAAITAALGEFEVQTAVASNVVIELGQPTPKGD